MPLQFRNQQISFIEDEGTKSQMAFVSDSKLLILLLQQEEQGSMDVQTKIEPNSRLII
jgi:hypothetical protein